MIIKNAELVDYRSRRKEDLLIKDGYIKKISKISKDHDYNDQVINGEGLIIMPSFVDLHVHFREPGFTEKEDIESGSKAANKGGYTICVSMANTDPVVDNKETHSKITKRAEEVGLVDLHQLMSLTKNMEGKELIDFDNLPESLRFLSDDGKGVLSNHLMYQACIEAYKKDLVIMVHAEDPDISSYDYRLAEDLITIRDIYLSKYTRARIHFSHVSTYDALEAIRIGKVMNIPISCEVTPHHIALSNLDYRVNPPIRKEKDRQKLIESIVNGTVDAISTDHAPHTTEDKEKGAPGTIGLETAFPVCYTTLVKSGLISLEYLSKLMSYNPSQILAINHGIIEEGYKADLVVVDLNEDSNFDESYFASKSSNSIFLNQRYESSIKMTIKGGKVVYENN